jgi:hypothetical protein
VLSQGTEKFVPEVLAALKQEKHPAIRFEPDGTPKPTKEQVDDLVYFRDYVVPELTRQKRDDQRSCMGCHGVAQSRGFSFSFVLLGGQAGADVDTEKNFTVPPQAGQ